MRYIPYPNRNVHSLSKEEVTKNKNLQSELHCRAYKLYLSEWHLGSHFVLHF